MFQIIVPFIGIIILLSGFPQLSETVYTPSLPEIAKALSISHAMAEYTLTIYLFGFAIGILFWGIISDRFGRKPCVLTGLGVFMIGSLCCYFSTNVTELMISRFIQALGGSVGSVLAQAICRDVYRGKALSNAYAAVGTSIAIFPAIGPVLGGLIAEYFGWSNIFLFLTVSAFFLTLIVFFNLQETHHTATHRRVSVFKVLKKMASDKKIIALSFLVAGCNGIGFSYFAEGSFCLIKVLGLTPSEFGATFLPISFAAMFGGLTSRKLLSYRSPEQVMNYGILSICTGSGLFSIVALLYVFGVPLSKQTLVVLIVGMQMMNMFGKAVVASNSLALALTEYRWCIGTASSLFGGSYYVVTSLFTFGMGMLHNHTILPMPLYFFAIGLSMLFVRYAVKEQLQVD